MALPRLEVIYDKTRGNYSGGQGLKMRATSTRRARCSATLDLELAGRVREEMGHLTSILS